MLLVAPNGRRALLLGHAGGANASDGSLTLDDEQAAVHPQRHAHRHRTQVRPSVYSSPAAPPSPAPTLPEDTDLSTFDGSLGEGRAGGLYVYDDAGQAVR